MRPESFGDFVSLFPSPFRLFRPLAQRKTNCGGTQCAVGATAVTGDVSLEYALEHIVDRNDGFSKVATARLRKMRGGG